MFVETTGAAGVAAPYEDLLEAGAEAVVPKQQDDLREQGWEQLQVKDSVSE